MFDPKTMLFGSNQDALDHLDRAARSVARLRQPMTDARGQIFKIHDPEVVEMIKEDVQVMAALFLNRHLLVSNPR